jgi:xanthine dehydrogenase iron-sulfur cluster and FAD-binding subunit A
MSDKFDETTLKFGSEADILWLRPVTLSELLSLKKQLPHAMLIAGGSGLGKV